MNQDLPHDIVGLAGYGILWWEFLLYAGILAGVAAGIALLVWWSRRKRSVVQNTPIADPFEALDAEIHAIQVHSPFDRPKQVEFYYRLSMILRRGIELVFKFPATDMTYRELKFWLDDNRPGFPMGEGDVLEFLQRSDMVKYADRLSSEENARQDQQQVVQWLKLLRARSRSAHNEVLP